MKFADLNLDTEYYQDKSKNWDGTDWGSSWDGTDWGSSPRKVRLVSLDRYRLTSSWSGTYVPDPKGLYVKVDVLSQDNGNPTGTTTYVTTTYVTTTSIRGEWTETKALVDTNKAQRDAEREAAAARRGKLIREADQLSEALKAAGVDAQVTYQGSMPAVTLTQPAAALEWLKTVASIAVREAAAKSDGE